MFNIMQEVEEQELQEFQEVFAVTDLSSAAEASRRVAYFVEKQAEIDAIIEQQIVPLLAKIEKIKEWGTEAKVEHVEKQAYYTNLLEQYMKAEIEHQLQAGKKPKKTVKLPYGKIALKAQQPKFEKNEAELFEYAKESGFVRVKEETNWADLKKACVVVGDKLYDTNGEQVPGVVVIEQADKFELKLD